MQLKTLPTPTKLTQAQFVAWQWVGNQKVVRVSHRNKRLLNVFEALVSLGLINKTEEPGAMNRYIYTWPTMVKCPDCQEYHEHPKRLY